MNSKILLKYSKQIALKYTKKNYKIKIKIIKLINLLNINEIK